MKTPKLLILPLIFAFVLNSCYKEEEIGPIPENVSFSAVVKTEGGYRITKVNMRVVEGWETIEPSNVICSKSKGNLDTDTVSISVGTDSEWLIDKYYGKSVNVLFSLLAKNNNLEKKYYAYFSIPRKFKNSKPLEIKISGWNESNLDSIPPPDWRTE